MMARTPKSQSANARPVASDQHAAPVLDNDTAIAAKITPPAAVASPSSSRGSVRVYRQGLGDCILVSVKRKNRDDFKLLIDCGVVLGTSNPVGPMTRVVQNILDITDKFVDILAITHEHWDHLSGRAVECS